jgi:hypothetical protein
MKVLFTGFTSRTVGSERNTYDYMSNVFVLEHALKLAGHEVTTRPVSLLEDPCIEEDFDCAVVGVAACQGFSSRFKVGALWALHKFGSRAGIFPSDGKNVGVFPNSVRTCVTGQHGDRTPYEYFLYGQLAKESANTVDKELAAQPEYEEILKATLLRLPHVEGKPQCDWRMLMPLHSWGNPAVYERVFGTQVTAWDPTHVAIPMQFTLTSGHSELVPGDGRLPFASDPGNPRKRAWVISSLQDQGPWLKKMKLTWPVEIVGNKRAVKKGEGLAYVPERQMIDTFYRNNWGHLAFGYPLADGGWWRMRYVHAALAGIVTCCDDADQIKMPDAYKFAKSQIERMTDDRLAALAQQQHFELMAASWPVDRAVETVDNFVRSLV